MFNKKTFIFMVSSIVVGSSYAIIPNDWDSFTKEDSLTHRKAIDAQNAAGPFTQLQTIRDGGSFSIAFSPSGSLAAVANRSDNTVTVYGVNGSTGQFTQIQTIAAGKTPVSIAFSPSGSLAAVANKNDNTVTVYGINGGAEQFALFTGNDSHTHINQQKGSFEKSVIV